MSNLVPASGDIEKRHFLNGAGEWAVGKPEHKPNDVKVFGLNGSAIQWQVSLRKDGVLDIDDLLQHCDPLAPFLELPEVLQSVENGPASDGQQLHSYLLALQVLNGNILKEQTEKALDEILDARGEPNVHDSFLARPSDLGPGGLFYIS